MHPLLIDFSMANDMACDMRTWLKHVQHLAVNNYDEEPGAREAGSLFHELFAAMLIPQFVDMAALYAKYFPNGSQEDRLSLVNLHTIYLYCMQNWDTNISKQFARILPDTIERVFVEELSPDLYLRGLYLTGMIDALAEDHQGNIWVIEHKTTGNIDQRWSDGWYTSPQGMIYQWGAERLFPGVAIKGTYIHAVELRTLPPYDGNLHKKCSSHKVKYEECQPLHMKQRLIGPIVYTDAQKKMWRREIGKRAGLLYAMQQSAFKQTTLWGYDQQGMFTYNNRANLCAGCMFKDFCHKGDRNVKFIPSMMHQIPDRFERAREILRERGVMNA